MSQNIKYIKYSVNGIEFNDFEKMSLVSYVKKQINITNTVVEVLEETTTYNIHIHNTNVSTKGQMPPKKRTMRVYNGLYYNSISFAQFCEMVTR